MWRKVRGWARSSMGAFRALLVSVSDPAFARLLGLGRSSTAGVEVTESSVLGLSAVYRALDLVSGTLAQLELRTLRQTGPRRYQQLKSFLDDPGKWFGMNPVVWKRVVFVHLSLYNEAFLLKIYGGAGQVVGLQPVHPQAVAVSWARPEDVVQPVGGKWFDVTLVDGTRQRHDQSTLVHVMAMTMDMLRGVWITSIGRDSLGTAIAGDRAAGRAFANGGSVAGIIAPADDEASWTDSAEIKNSVTDSMTGWENTNGIAVLNKRVKFTQLGLSAADAQMLESRMFSIEDVARWFGVPPFELMQTDKQTSFGTGIEAQQRGLGRQTLAPKAKCLEAEVSRLLSDPLFARLDFSELERPAPERIADQAASAWNDDLITRNEARNAMGYDPVPGGDVFKSDTAAPAPAPAPAEDGVPSA